MVQHTVGIYVIKTSVLAGNIRSIAGVDLRESSHSFARQPHVFWSYIDARGHGAVGCKLQKVAARATADL